MLAKKPKPDEKPQSERFIEAAHEVGADETKEGFEKAFEKTARIYGLMIRQRKRY